MTNNPFLDFLNLVASLSKALPKKPVSNGGSNGSGSTGSGGTPQTWATVTATTPAVKIRIDGEAVPLDVDVTDTVGNLQVGDRVYTTITDRRVSIIGKSGGPLAAVEVKVQNAIKAPGNVSGSSVTATSGGVSAQGNISTQGNITAQGYLDVVSYADCGSLRINGTQAISSGRAGNLSTLIVASSSAFGGSGTFESALLNPGRNTTSSGANVRMSSSGEFHLVSSSAKTKLDVEDVGVDPHLLLDVPIRDWYDLTEVEAYSDFLNGDREDFEPGPFRRVPGVVAEEVEAAGLGNYVTYEDDGEVQGVMYDRLWHLLIPLVREQREQIASLESRIAALEAAITPGGVTPE